MTASTEPRGGLDLGWTPGEDGWGPAMNANLLRISRLGFHASVLSMTTTAPPGSPTNGAGYIIPAGASGAWAGRAGQVAVWDGSAWAYAVPRDGWTVHVVGTGLVTYEGGEWSQANIASASGVGAEPYAGAPAQTSFWRSTAAGVRAWVQLVAADITDLATTLAGYLTKANPTFTGDITGAGSMVWKSGAANYFSMYASAMDWGLRDLSDVGAIVSYPLVVIRGVGGEIRIGYSGGLRPVRIGGALKNDALAGAGARALVAQTDGTIDDQDAATFRGTIGALASTNPEFTGTLKQGGTTRITSGGGAWLTSVQSANLVGAADRPVAADLTGTLQPKTPEQFRNMIFALAASLKGSANGVAELGADVKVPVAQLPSAALLALGETSATAYRGDRGKIAYDHSQLATGNPHGTTAADVGALAISNPSFTGPLSQGATERITAGGDGRFTSLRASGLAASNTYLLRLDANGGLVASPVRVAPGVGVVFEQAASLQAGGGAWGGSAYTSWAPSAIIPIADDTAGNAMPSLGTGYLWNSQRLNALTITDGAAASPYRGRIRADRWVGTSAVLISGTTSATSWFAAGAGEGSPSLPANYLKGGRRVRAKGRTSCQSCAADSAPEFAFKIGSTTIKTQAKAFTVASGNAIYIDFDVDFFADGDGFLVAVGDIKFYSPAVGGSYEYKISYVGAYDGSTAKTIDATIKPSSSGETWSRNTAFIEA